MDNQQLNEEYLLINYIITNIIGKGSYGSVYHAIN